MNKGWSQKFCASFKIKFWLLKNKLQIHTMKIRKLFLFIDNLASISMKKFFFYFRCNLSKQNQSRITLLEICTFKMRCSNKFSFLFSGKTNFWFLQKKMLLSQPLSTAYRTIDSKTVIFHLLYWFRTLPVRNSIEYVFLILTNLLLFCWKTGLNHLYNFEMVKISINITNYKVGLSTIKTISPRLKTQK